MTWSVWLTVAVILFVLEILTPGAFFFACLGIGALFASLVTLFALHQSLAWITFAVISLLSMYTIRPLARKFLQSGKPGKSNVDALIGQPAWVTEAINPPHLGMVKIEGEYWRAEAAEPVDAQTSVMVTAVSGTRLVVQKKSV